MDNNPDAMIVKCWTEEDRLQADSLAVTHGLAFCETQDGVDESGNPFQFVRYKKELN